MFSNSLKAATLPIATAVESQNNSDKDSIHNSNKIVNTSKTQQTNMKFLSGNVNGAGGCVNSDETFSQYTKKHHINNNDNNNYNNNNKYSRKQQQQQTNYSHKSNNINRKKYHHQSLQQHNKTNSHSNNKCTNNNNNIYNNNSSFIKSQNSTESTSPSLGTNILSGVTNSLDINSNTVSDNCLQQNSVIKSTTLNEAIVDIERNTSSTSEGGSKFNNSALKTNNNCTSWSNFQKLQLLTSKVNLSNTNVATSTSLTASRNYNCDIHNENVVHNEKALNDIIYKVTNGGRLNNSFRKRVYYKNGNNSNNKAHTEFKCKQQTSALSNSSPKTDVITIVVDETNCGNVKIYGDDIEADFISCNIKETNIEKIPLNENLCEVIGNIAHNQINDKKPLDSLNACTAMTTTLLAPTTTTSAKNSAAIVTTSTNTQAPALAVSTTKTATTTIFVDALAAKEKEITPISNKFIVEPSLASVVTNKPTTIATTVTTNSSSPAPNSYTLDFLHSVGVQMTGGANLNALKTSMGQMRPNDVLPYASHTSGTNIGSTTIRNSYNFPHLLSADQRQTSQQQQQQRCLSNDGSNVNVNSSSSNNRNGHYQTQNNHHHHHQPQQLTIASFLQKELLEEMLIRTNNDNTNLSRNTNCNGVSNIGGTNYNNNAQNYRNGGNQQRCHNYYHSYYRNHPQSQQLCQQNYLTLQHSDFNNNNGGCVVGDNAARRNGNMENVGNCNIQRSHAYLHSYHAGNSNNNNHRHGNQQHMRNSQLQQTQRNQHKNNNNNTNVQPAQHQNHQKKLNYVSSSASSCSVSSSASCSSSVSSASSTSSQTSTNSHRQQKINKNPNEAFPSKNNSTNTGSHRSAQHRSQTNHHHHGNHHHNGNNYHHQQHQYSTSMPPSTPQHQNFYNLTYVNTNNAKASCLAKKPVDNQTEELSSALAIGCHQPLQPNYIQQKLELQPSTSQSNQVFTPPPPPQPPLNIISCSQLDEVAATTAAGSAISVAVDNNTSTGPAITTTNDYDSDSSSVHSATLCNQRVQKFSDIKSLSTPSLSLSIQDIQSNATMPKSITPTHLSNNSATPILQTPMDFVYTTILPLATTPQQQQLQRYMNHQSVASPQQQHYRNEVVSLLNTVQNYTEEELAILQQQHHQHQLYFAAGKHLAGSTAVSNSGYWSPMQQHANFYNHTGTTTNMMGSPSCTSSTTSLSPRLNEHDQSPLCTSSVCPPSTGTLDEDHSTGPHGRKYNETQLPVVELAALQHQRIAQNFTTNTSRNSRIRNQHQPNINIHTLTQQLPPALSPHATTSHSYQIGSPSAQHNLLFSNAQTSHLRPNSCCSTSTHDFYAHTPPDRFLARAHLIEAKETPTTLLNNSKWDKLSQGIWQKFISSQQTEETFKQKMRLWRYLYIIIKNAYPRYGLYLVGSTISGFGSNSSDVDMCLVSRCTSSIDPRMEALFNLTILRDCLSKTGDFENFNLIEAKVPILRFRDRIHQLEVDLNFNNCVGIKNTHLLYCYSQLDWRLRPLVLVTKLWAQFHNINNAKNMTISSYSLVLMVIHFLQYAVSPPVLPCLHDQYPDKFPLLRSNDFGYVDMNETMEPYESQNVQSIGELFLSFLEYYSTFDYSQNAISLRTGGLLPINICRQAKSLKNDIHQWKELCIEEPFDLTNTARSVYDYETFERVKTIFIESWRILKETLDLNSIFSPISITSSVDSALFNSNAVNNHIEKPTSYQLSAVSQSEGCKHDSEINGLIANSKQSNFYNYNGNGDDSNNHKENKLSALIS